jgi:NhaP-type Na+/H+ or K+/H+ antiporter
MNFRFILQPLIAIFVLGMKDGRMDAKAGMPPFIFDLILRPEHRRRDLKSAFHRLLVPVIVGAILDGIAQYLIFKHIRPGAALLVGAFVMGIPYSLSRGITNRIVSARMKRAAGNRE